MGSASCQDPGFLSRQELLADLEVKAGAMAELERVVGSLKCENVKLSRGLRQLRGLFQDIVSALRTFFSAPSRRDWFQAQKDDLELVIFFQRLISWYRKVADSDKDPILRFYRRMWEYERGEPPADALDELGGARAAPPPQQGKRVEGPGLRSSAELYDACLARCEADSLRQKVRRLTTENEGLRQSLSTLEQELRDLSAGGPARVEAAESAAGQVPGPPDLPPPRPAAAAPAEEACGSQTRPPSSPSSASVPAASSQLQLRAPPPPPSAPAAPFAAAAAAPPPRLDRTLAHLAAGQPRWRRLLDDPSGLFSASDVVDGMYEQYLEDVLKLMELHGCHFKRAVELSAEAAADAAAAAAGAAQHQVQADAAGGHARGPHGPACRR